MKEPFDITTIPLHLRASCIPPTPENWDRVAAEAAAKREAAAKASRNHPMSLVSQWGISLDLAQFLQRLEGKILELEKEVAILRAADTSTLPRHMRDVERRA